MAIPYPKISMGISNSNLAFKRPFRFAFIIDGVTMAGGLDVKISHKAQRPQFGFKEITCEHINETIYMPGKIDFKPISFTLYDTWNPQVNKENPVFKWIESYYFADQGIYGFAGQNRQAGANQFKKKAYLNMYDGLGCVVESWAYDNAWPQDINFNECDYSSNDVMSIDITLRYDRAYPIY